MSPSASSSVSLASPAAQARALRRMKAVALAALLLAVALMLASHWQGRQGVWGWVGAFAEAATVGALADWFAVVALFRRPLGLPIAHTAIIVRNQQRIAENLAAFVRERFLAESVLLPRIHAYNPALHLGRFLGQPLEVQRLAAGLQAWAVQALVALDDARMQRELLRVVKKHLRQCNVAPALAQLMRVLGHAGQHQRVLNAALEKLAQWVGTPDVRQIVAEKMVEVARREYPKMTWLADALDYSGPMAQALARALAQALIDEVQAVLGDAQHPLRLHYASEVAQLVQRLQHDPATQRRAARIKNQLLRHEALQDYAGQLWARLRSALHDDLVRSDSRLAQQFVVHASHLGQRLREDARWQEAANAQLRIAVRHLAAQLREVAPEHIRQTVQGWDAGFMVREIERSVGRDLQFIRLNGTLMGGLVGLALHALWALTR